MAYGATNPDNEDFRNRYQTETAGVPDYLAKAAATNLATQDAGIAKFNAVSRMNPSPGVGAPGSTAQTDATNLSVAAAMDRADLADRTIPTSISAAPSLSDTHVEDIMARRTQLASQKQELMNTLGSTRMDDVKKRASILGTWHALDTEDKNLLHEHQLVVTDAAKASHEEFTRNQHIASAKDFEQMAGELTDLQNNPDIKPGTPAFHSAALNIVKNHGQGFLTQAGQTLFRNVSEVHDKLADLNARASIPTHEIESRYAKLLGNIQEHQDASKAEEVKNIAAKRANAPYTKAGEYHADQTELAALTKRYPSLTAGESIQAAPPAAAAATPPPNITPEAHAALKPGEKFWWNGQQITKK